MEKIEFFDAMPDGMLSLVDDFIIRAEEKERTSLSIMVQIDRVLHNGGRLWIIDMDGQWAGYAFAEILPSEYEKSVCLVHELYIHPSVKPGLAKVIDSEIALWAKDKGADEMAFYTRRDIEAFKSILQPGWQQDSVVMKRPL